MRASNLVCLIIAFTAFYFATDAQHHHVATGDQAEASSENSKLIDEFGKLGHCDLTGRYDTFFAELSQNPDTRGFVIVYQGRDAFPADYGDPPAKRMFQNHMTFRGFDSARVTVVNGGFQEEGKTQLWIVPPGALQPTPTNTVIMLEIPRDRTFLFYRSYLALEEEDPESSEYVLPSVKAELRAERERMAEEHRLERLTAGDQDVDVVPVPEEESARSEQADDELSDQEQLDLKFDWLRDSFGKLLVDRKDARGVIVFYADDERFDIGRVRSLIGEGVNRLIKSTSLQVPRIEVVYGGYRNTTDVEFWVVPKGGQPPVPKPEERPVEQPDGDVVEN